MSLEHRLALLALDVYLQHLCDVVAAQESQGALLLLGLDIILEGLRFTFEFQESKLSFVSSSFLI